MDQESLAQIRQIVTDATQGLRQDMQGGLTELREEMVASAGGLRQEIVASADEAKRHTGVLFEDLQHKFELVIEGQQGVRQQIQGVRLEVEHESQETRALLRVSYQELHQRVEDLAGCGKTMWTRRKFIGQ